MLFSFAWLRLHVSTADSSEQTNVWHSEQESVDFRLHTDYFLWTLTVLSFEQAQFLGPFHQSVVSVPQIITVVTVHLGESGADLRAASLVKVESVPQRFYVYRSGIRGVAVNAAAENNACFKQKLFQYVRRFEF